MMTTLSIKYLSFYLHSVLSKVCKLVESMLNCTVQVSQHGVPPCMVYCKIGTTTCAIDIHEHASFSRILTLYTRQRGLQTTDTMILCMKMHPSDMEEEQHAALMGSDRMRNIGSGRFQSLYRMIS